MNNGRYVSSRFPYLAARIQVRRQAADVEALLDTGFDGDVAVPEAIVSNDRPPDGHSRWALADGSMVLVPYYQGTIQLGDLGPFPATVIALGDEPLVGAGAARHVTIVLDHGRRVIVEP